MRYPLELPPGLNGDDTTFAAEGRWADGSNVRFWRGRPQVIGGWELLSTTALTGICRTIFGWTDLDSLLNIAFGTHSKLQLWQSDGVYDITPYGPPSLLGANPLASTNASGTVVVTHTAHGYADGISVKFYGATTFNGLDAANLNGVRVITVINANSYSFVAGAADTASATGSGGGSAIYVVPQTTLPAGAEDGTGGAGYGTGTYSTGTYSTPSSEDYYPRTWSLGAWGENLLASPRGGSIYTWENVTSARAIWLENAPLEITYMLVVPTNNNFQVFAFGTNEEASGVFNPMCIRSSDLRDNTDWTTSTSNASREYVLEGGGGIVAARMIGTNIGVWTNAGFYLGTFVGSLNQPWRFDRVASQCGLIGPNAVVVVGEWAFWLGPDLQVYAYALGGSPYPLSCPIREGLADNFAASQGAKVVASSISAYNEIRFDYPDNRDGAECSRYIAAHVPTLLNSPENAWYRGTMARTAFVDAPPATPAYPLGVDTDGYAYWHEKGQSADGSAFAWSIETADNVINPDRNMKVRGIWSDFTDQVGPIMVQVIARFSPQGDETTVDGTAMAVGAVKSDVVATGKFIRIRFYGNSAPTAARLGSPIVDAVPAGSR
jgi:hypothetical protein